METYRIHPNEVDRVVQALLEGQVVAFPTETVFGFACQATSFDAYERLMQIKHRPAEKSFPILIESLTKLPTYVKVDPLAQAIINRFWPGPLTLVLSSQKNHPIYLPLGQRSMAVRYPQHPFVQALLKKLPFPLFLTSANRSGQPSCQDDEQVMAQFKGEIPLIVQGKGLSQIASTILDLTVSPPTILRQGQLTLEEIMRGIQP